MGIEPTLSAWEAGVLPLNYTRTKKILLCRLQIVDPLRSVAHIPKTYAPATVLNDQRFLALPSEFSASST